MFQSKWQHNSKKFRGEYAAWGDARRRCNTSNSKMWKHYGGRGISMCDRWINNFDFFMEDMGQRPENMTLERIDVNGNYEPSNCVWASARAQSLNRRNTVRLTVDGITLSASEWADKLGIARNSVFHRIKRGYELSDILSKKSLVKKPKHGTISMYVGKKCRCEKCRKANSQYTKNRRLQNV